MQKELKILLSANYKYVHVKRKRNSEEYYVELEKSSEVSGMLNGRTIQPDGSTFCYGERLTIEISDIASIVTFDSLWREIDRYHYASLNCNLYREYAKQFISADEERWLILNDQMFRFQYLITDNPMVLAVQKSRL